MIHGENISKINEFALSYDDVQKIETNMNFDAYDFNELKNDKDINSNFRYSFKKDKQKNTNDFRKTKKTPFVKIFYFF